MSNFNFNKVIIGGRITGDPELRTTPSGVSVTSFSVAVNRRSSGSEESKADFFNVTAWRSTAEFITKFFKKSSPICLIGTLETRTYVDHQGIKHFATSIVADEAYFVDSKSEATHFSSAPAAAYVPDSYTAPKFEEINDDDEVPF